MSTFLNASDRAIPSILRGYLSRLRGNQMSWSVRLGDVDQNVTYNLSPMFAKALNDTAYENGFEGLNGLKGEKLISVLNHMIQRFEREPYSFRLLNPKNGWGTYEGALLVLYRLQAKARRSPCARLYIT